MCGRETGLVNLLDSSFEKRYSGLEGDKSAKEAAVPAGKSWHSQWLEWKYFRHCHKLAKMHR